jgi:hypothetical protein
MVEFMILTLHFPESLCWELSSWLMSLSRRSYGRALKESACRLGKIRTVLKMCVSVVHIVPGYAAASAWSKWIGYLWDYWPIFIRYWKGGLTGKGVDRSGGTLDESVETGGVGQVGVSHRECRSEELGVVLAFPEASMELRFGEGCGRAKG